MTIIHYRDSKPESIVDLSALPKMNQGLTASQLIENENICLFDALKGGFTRTVFCLYPYRLEMRR